MNRCSIVNVRERSTPCSRSDTSPLWAWPGRTGISQAADGSSGEAEVAGRRGPGAEGLTRRRPAVP